MDGRRYWVWILAGNAHIFVWSTLAGIVLGHEAMKLKPFLWALIPVAVFGWLFLEEVVNDGIARRGGIGDYRKRLVSSVWWVPIIVFVGVPAAALWGLAFLPAIMLDMMLWRSLFL